MRKLAHHVGLEPNPVKEVGHLLVSVRALGNLVDEERFRNGVRLADAGRDSQTDPGK